MSCILLPYQAKKTLPLAKGPFAREKEAAVERPKFYSLYKALDTLCHTPYTHTHHKPIAKNFFVCKPLFSKVKKQSEYCNFRTRNPLHSTTIRSNAAVEVRVRKQSATFFVVSNGSRPEKSDFCNKG